MNAGQPEESIAETVEAYRERFSSDLAGRWDSSIGFAPGPSDVWAFYRDGTGKRYEYSSSGDRISWFDWLPVAERTIKFRVTKEGELLASGDIAIDDNSDEPMAWKTIAYDFKSIDYYGLKVVMFQVLEQEIFKFWWTIDYLRYTGSAEGSAKGSAEGSTEPRKQSHRK